MDDRAYLRGLATFLRPVKHFGYWGPLRLSGDVVLVAPEDEAEWRLCRAVIVPEVELPKVLFRPGLDYRTEIVGVKGGLGREAARVLLVLKFPTVSSPDGTLAFLLDPSDRGHRRWLLFLAQCDGIIICSGPNGSVGTGLVIGTGGLAHAVRETLSGLDASRSVTPSPPMAGAGRAELLTHLRARAGIRSDIFKCAKRGQLVEVARLVGQSPDLVNARDGRGETPVYRAASEGHVKVVEFLAQKGANVDLPRDDGCTPLIAAAWNGCGAAVQHLVALGASVTACDSSGRTALHAAVTHTSNRCERAGIARLLLDSGACLCARSHAGETPLHLAAMSGCPEVVELLISRSAELDAADSQGNSPLHSAVLARENRIVEILLSSGARASTKNRRGETPLHLAATRDCPGIAELLVSHSAELSAVDDQGNTPLHLAAMGDYPNMVEILISHSAELHTANYQGYTPLHLAVLGSNKRIAEILLFSGAKADTRTPQGDTPLRCAKASGCQDMVKLLLKHRPKKRWFWQ